jgi:hypothetical protein
METMLLRMFQQQVLLQCKFVLLASHEVDASLIAGNNTRTFYALQNLLTAAANISKALWGKGGGKEGKGEERRPLRESIGVADDSPLRRIAIRDDFEHFDERLTRWWEQSTSHNYADLNLGDIRMAIKGISDQDTFRCFNPQTGEVMFWGTDFNLKLVITEIIHILPKLEAEARKPHWDEPVS